MRKRFVLLLILSMAVVRLSAQSKWIEAEDFTDKGGWTVDGQFFDQMGSAYLNAHGLGLPVKDASTKIAVNKKGSYHVWIRTFNWNAPWNSTQAPGKFQLLIDGKIIGDTLGRSPDHWGWVLAGKTDIQGNEITLTLHDLTGFNGRCDAILLAQNPGLILPDSGSQLKSLRFKISGAVEPTFAGKYDLVVVGGGVAGMCAAISAARKGLKTALIHNRPVVGGNNSPEIKVGIQGGFNLPPYDAIGNIVSELGNAYADQNHVLSILNNEKNLTLFLNTHASGVEMTGNNIHFLIATDLETNETFRFESILFADCTGDGNLGYMAGADYKMGRELRSEYGETLAPEIPDKLGYGSTLKWETKNMGTPQSFPVLPWAVQFSENTVQYAYKSQWDWETGFRHDQIEDFEYIRDYSLRVIYGNWSYIKNFSKRKDEFRNFTFSEVSYVPGKRESRRLSGDYIITQNDIEDPVEHYNDGIVKATYSIDQHFPQPENSLYFPDEEFRSIQKHNLNPLGVSRRNIKPEDLNKPYMIPYRCLYSRNIGNLFMAGRDISATRLAMASLRVQGTTGMMGEVVGIAAFLCIKNDCLPHDIYINHLEEFKEALKMGVPRRNEPVMMPGLH